MAQVLVEVADLVAVVTLNRPERRNAISAELLGRLRAALAGLDARPDVRAIVLTGADPALSAQGLTWLSLASPVVRSRPRPKARSSATLPRR